MKYLGCAYYPEYWGPKRFETDAKLMRRAGINIARIGEFAWSRMEPEEGRFALDWLHRCIETLGKQDVSILMCTPTAAPPAWLTSAYPDVCLVRSDGKRSTHGKRRHYCSTSETYRSFSARVTDVLSREVARHKNVVAWQLDNEFGPEMSWCHCDGCQARFQAWLRDRYKTLSELNRRWATGFWSVDYSDWRQVRLAADGSDYYSANILDSKRFWSDMMIDFARHQTAILRANHPKALVTTNGMGPIFSPINYYKLFDELDVACDDLYFDIATMDANSAAMNVYRSMKPGRRYWITETGSGALDHNKPPHPGQFRAWAWSSLAHGAEAHFVFRWRTCLSGQEQELQGILEHSGKPRHRYKAVQSCFLELRRLWPKLKDLPLPDAPVAIVLDYESLWGYEASRVVRDVDYTGLIYRIHRKLYDRNIVVDFVPPGRDLKSYRLVVLPSQVMVTPDFAEDLTRHVKSGGMLLAMGQIGMRDANDNYLDKPGPDNVRDLLGASIEGGIYLGSHVGADEALWVPVANRRAVDVPLAGSIGGTELRGRASAWVGDITLRGGQALAHFTGDAYEGQPAVVRKRTGKGTSLYVATVRLDDDLFARVLDSVLSLADIDSGPVTPDYVEVVRRGKVTFVVNHTPQDVQVDLGGAGTAWVGSFKSGVARLGGYGVCVVKTP